MKRYDKRVIRGQALAASVKRITLFDGRFDTGFRLKFFRIAPRDITTAEAVMCKIRTQEKSHSTEWRWANTDEVAWATWGQPTNARPEVFGLVDEDTIIVHDLYLDFTGDTGEYINYWLEMEKVDISEWEGALAMVKARSQA